MISRVFLKIPRVIYSEMSIIWLSVEHTINEANYLSWPSFKQELLSSLKI